MVVVFPFIETKLLVSKVVTVSMDKMLTNNKKLDGLIG